MNQTATLCGFSVNNALNTERVGGLEPPLSPWKGDVLPFKLCPHVFPTYSSPGKQQIIFPFEQASSVHCLTGPIRNHYHSYDSATKPLGRESGFGELFFLTLSATYVQSDR